MALANLLTYLVHELCTIHGDPLVQELHKEEVLRYFALLVALHLNEHVLLG